MRLMGMDSSVRVQAGMLAAMVLLSGCELLKRLAPTDPGPVPSTRTVLELMPESAGAVFAMPPIDAAGRTFFAAFQRFAPTDVPPGDVATAFVHFLGHLLNAPQAESLGEVFETNGIAADAPIGFFMEAGESPATAIVFTTTDPAKIDALLSTISAFLPSNEPLSTGLSNDTQEFDLVSGTQNLYLVEDGRVILSTSPDFARAIRDRIHDPMPLRYGTAECPAESPTEFAALIRMDSMQDVATSFFANFTGSEGLILGAEETISPELFSSDPMVVTMDWTADKARVSARLDLAEHDGLRRRLGRPEPLRLARAAPDNTSGLLSLRFNPETKSFMLDSFGDMVGGAGDGPSQGFQVGGALSEWTQFVDDELTLAMTGVDDAGRPTGVGMLAIQNRGALANIAMSLPLPGEPVEVYRRTEIRRAPDADLYYSTARNTLVVGNRLEEVRQTLDHLLEGDGPGLESFETAIDEDVPRYAALFLSGESIPAVADGLLDMRLDELPWLPPLEGQLQDLRMTSDLNGTWVDGRIEAHFKPLADQASTQAAPKL